ncbi:hypothetical protein [Lysobacter antibioticus]|uniref:Uncharacterized protein n=1 Tax=Lysobacter antibioticus TaxID=84531 RepID=A0A0S2F506_LYSAN|nr:hypothetical protein [Lysobacter antibioticus]ALN64587.1 hypothetical protein GLA29479_3736 [Lysobacter antibioticus]ALN78582.1 hypothetical protein LA76x_0421 [Lysobacter antibioticus]
MPNLSYCRFRNTLVDLNECQSALESLIHDEPLIPLSREELAAAKELARTCLGIVYLLCEAGGEEIADEPDMAKLVEKFNREAAAP